MKKLILASALLTAMPCTKSLADEVPGIKISTATADSELEISAIGNIKYGESEMIVTMKDGTTATFAIDEITRMTFGDITTAIQSIASNGDSNAEITITDLSGRTIAKGKAESIASRTDLHGIMIISNGNESKKVIIR